MLDVTCNIYIITTIETANTGIEEMAKLIKKIELETGDYYELYETGKTYKSIYTLCEGAIKEEKKHSHIQAALNNSTHKYFEQYKALEVA